MNNKIGCVVVTYNRINKLKKALAAYASQLENLEYIIVVDNASTDGTRDFLEKWQTEKSTEQRYIISLEENVGGSGGFYAGQKKAIELAADWIMLADDDAYPEPNYIKGIKSYITEHNCDNIAVLCGSVWEGKTYVSGHRSVYLRHFIDNNMIIPAQENSVKKVNDLFYIDFSSYVGPIIKKDALNKAGLCNPDFFIWMDDFEHMYRLRRCGIIGYLPQYKIIHDTENLNNVINSLSWKNYYGLRNKLYFLKKYRYMYYIPTLAISIFKATFCPFKGKKLKEVRLRLSAILDASRCKLGIHDIYRPGWKP